MIPIGSFQALNHHVQMEMCLAYRKNNNLKFKRHYQVHYKIWSNVIMEAKRIYYDKKF